MRIINKLIFLGIYATVSAFLHGCDALEDDPVVITTNDNKAPVSEFADAKSIALSEIKSDTVNIEEDNLIDYYKVDINTTGKYTLYLESLVSGTNPDYVYTLDLEVYNSDENIIATLKVAYLAFNSDAKENNQMEVDFQDIGTHYFKIFRNRRGEIKAITTSYQIHIEPSIANGLIQDDDLEFNDTQSQATPLGVKEFIVDVNGTINTVLHTDHYDWYELKDLQDGVYTLYIKTRAGTEYRGNGDSIVAKIYDSYSNIHTNFDMEHYGVLDSADKWQRLTFEVSTPASYFLRLEREYSLAANYSFKVIPSIANGYIQDEYGEPNDEQHLAKTITLLDTNTTIEDSINMTDITDSDDWFKFTSDVTQTLNLKLQTLAATSDGTYTLRAEILNKYGIVISTIPTNDYLLNSANLEVSDSFSVDSDEEYYIHINRRTNAPTSYKITIIK